MHGAVQILDLTDIEITVTISELEPMLDIDVRNPKVSPVIYIIMTA